jgi:hypothetical protein
LSSIDGVGASGDERNGTRIVRLGPGIVAYDSVLHLGHDDAHMSMCAATRQRGDGDCVGVEKVSCHLNVFKGRLMVDLG